MKLINVLLVLAGVVTVGLNAEAKGKAAADKPAKLVVCRDYKIVADKGTATSSSTDGEYDVALCFDGAKPTVLRYFSEVTVNVQGEGNVKVVVGSR